MRPVEGLSEPAPMTTVPPSRPSTSAGRNQALMPGPVAMACHTSSGVPGTSSSTADSGCGTSSGVGVMPAVHH